MNKFFVYLNAFFKAVDLTCTYIFVVKLGSEFEWNPIQQFFIDDMGLFGAFMINISLTSVTLWAFFKLDNKLTWVIVSTILGLAALANVVFIYVIGV